MPLLYTIEGSLGLVMVRDRVTLAETVQLTDAQLADPRFAAAADLLVDASTARPSLSYAERNNRTRWATLAGRVRRIAIAAAGDLIFPSLIARVRL
jgi:hypothetical protein